MGFSPNTLVGPRPAYVIYGTPSAAEGASPNALSVPVADSRALTFRLLLGFL